MTARKLDDIDRLRQILAYDATTGVFRWRISLGSRAQAGTVAGCLTSLGYVEIGWGGHRYYAHRLAWLYVHGAWPAQMIDHIDGDRTNNRIENLRDVSRSVNLQNRKRAARNNQTGFLGVSQSRSKFKAQIEVGGKNIFLGQFDTPEEAHAVYCATKRRVHEGCCL